MNRKLRMSCNGVQNIERDFFKFVMIDDPPHITLHLDSSRNNIQIIQVGPSSQKEFNSACPLSEICVC